MASIEEIIADFVKGAHRAGGNVQLGTTGLETNLVRSDKTGSISPGAAALAGNLALPAFGGPIGAALASDEGHRVSGAAGAILGGAGGALAGGVGGAGLGALGAALTRNPELGKLLLMGGGALGAIGGGMAGEYYGANKGGLKQSALERAFGEGVKGAAARFKVAFAPLVAAGLSALAPTAARGLMGRVAPRAMGAIGKPVAGALFDAGTQMAAQKALS